MHTYGIYIQIYNHISLPIIIIYYHCQGSLVRQACQSEWKNKIQIKLSSQSAFPREYGDHLKRIQDTSLWWPHIYLSSKWQVQIYCRRASVAHRKQILGLTEGTLLEGGLRRAIPDLLKSLQCRLKTSGLLTGALTTAQGFSYHLGCVDIHVCEEKVMLDTIFWIFSSFFRMLDLTAQILSCWSLINCSSSASSDFRGSTTVSVILRHRQRNGLTQKNETIKAFGYLNHDKDWDALIESYYSWSCW